MSKISNQAFLLNRFVDIYKPAVNMPKLKKFTNVEVDLFRSLVAILSAFEEETRHVCRDDAHLSEFIPSSHLIYTYMGRRYIQEENSQAKQFITFLRKEIEERFRRCWEDATLLKATIVDSCYAYSTAVLPESTWDTAEAHLISWSIERIFSKARFLFNNKLRANLSGPRAEQCLLVIAINTSELLGWRNVAGAVGVAWDKIQYEKILPDYDNLNLTWQLTECIESFSAGALIQYVDDNANVVLGPPCSSAAMVSGTVAKYYNFPLFLWGPPFTSELMNVDDYPTIASTAPSTMKLVITVLKCNN
uniref:ANF_receptor domain-containing protein n=1 Tax=Heterorhabditis bacteriophora TaxID=37862 RepID=A0A1I7XMT0_HETBA